MVEHAEACDWAWMSVLAAVGGTTYLCLMFIYALFSPLAQVLVVHGL